MTRNPVIAEPKRLVNGPCWNLKWFNQCFHCSLAVAAEYFDVFEDPHVQRKQGGSARHNRRHCGEEKNWKVGHEGTATDLTYFEPYRNHSVQSIGSNCQFSCLDRGDIMYCAEELTRNMAKPTTADWEKAVRLERYLKNRPKVQLWFQFQETPCQLETFSDTD